MVLRTSEALDSHIRNEASRQEWEPKYRRAAGIRLKRVEGCETCKKYGDQGPDHDASAACRNGFDAQRECLGK